MGHWIQRTSMPTPRHDLQSLAVGERIYAISGADDLTLDIVEVYDVDTDSWSVGPPIPTPRGWIGAALLDGQIYVGCGKTIRTAEEKERTGDERHFQARDVLEALDPKTHTWSALSPSPSGARAGVSVAACGGLIYIIGGNTMAGNDESERTHLDAVDIYDPQSGEWSPGPPFPYPVQGTNAISVDERVYVFGGHRQDVPEAESYQRDTHVLDPRVGRWKKLAPMFTRRESMGITTHGERCIFTCGGHNNDAADPVDHYTDAVEIYDVESDSWSREAPLPERKAWLDAATVGDRIFAMGGANKLRGPGFKWIGDMHEFAP